MTLAEATRQYQVALERLRGIKCLDVMSLEKEYEDAQRDVTDAKKAMEIAWLRHIA